MELVGTKIKSCSCRFELNSPKYEIAVHLLNRNDRLKVRYKSESEK